MSNGKEWTPRDAKTLVYMAGQNFTNRQIAYVTGHNVRTVQRRREMLGLERCTRNDWTAPLRRAAKVCRIAA